VLTGLFSCFRSVSVAALLLRTLILSLLVWCATVSSTTPRSSSMPGASCGSHLTMPVSQRQWFWSAKNFSSWRLEVMHSKYSTSSFHLQDKKDGCTAHLFHPVFDTASVIYSRVCVTVWCPSVCPICWPVQHTLYLGKSKKSYFLAVLFTHTQIT